MVDQHKPHHDHIPQIAFRKHTRCVWLPSMCLRGSCWYFHINKPNIIFFLTTSYRIHGKAMSTVNPSASNLPPLVYVYKAFSTVSFAWKIVYFIKESYRLPSVLSTLDKCMLYFILFFIYFWHLILLFPSKCILWCLYYWDWKNRPLAMLFFHPFKCSNYDFLRVHGTVTNSWTAAVEEGSVNTGKDLWSWRLRAEWVSDWPPPLQRKLNFSQEKWTGGKSFF